MRLCVVTVALSGCLLAAGCSSDNGGTTAAPPTAETSHANQAEAKHLTADQIATTLQARGLPMKSITVFDENTDPNKRLGRPGQYTSKVNFSDPRAKTPGQPASGGKDVTDGGSVEVFDTASDAAARGQYIQTVTRAIQIVGTEYDFVSGTALLRLTGTLPPSAAREYATAFQSIVGAPLVTPSPTHT